MNLGTDLCREGHISYVYASNKNRARFHRFLFTLVSVASFAVNFKRLWFSFTPSRFLLDSMPAAEDGSHHIMNQFMSSQTLSGSVPSIDVHAAAGRRQVFIIAI